MNRTDLQNIIVRNFPNAIGSLITGSQKDEITYREGSDVDIVVFDLSYPHIVFLEMFYNNVKIDCTLISLNDINNILVNEYSDSKGIVLKMICQGLTLTGDIDILNEIQTCVNDCFEKLNSNNNPTKDRLTLGLRWLHKYLQRNLSVNERFILMCEFVNKMTSLRSVELGYWETEYLHKVQLLEKHDPTFISALNSIFNFALETSDQQVVINYIEQHVLSTNANSLTKQGAYITFDILIDDFSLQVFVNSSLKKIMSNDNLKDAYQYFYVPDSLYTKTYKYSICVCFKCASPQMLQKIVIELNHVFSKSETFHLKYSILKLMPAIEYVSNQTSLIELKKILSQSFIEIFAKKNGDELIGAAIYICKELIEILDLQDSDKYQLCELMNDRWCFSQQELLLHQNKNDFIYSLNDRKSALLAESNVHKRKNTAFTENRHQSVPIQRLLSAFPDAIAFCLNKSTLPFFPEGALKRLIIEDYNKSYAFLYLIPEILQSLNLTYYQKALTLSSIIKTE